MKMVIFGLSLVIIGFVSRCNDNHVSNIEEEFGEWSIAESGVSSALFDVDFVDNLTGWIVGDSGTVLKTTNNGLSWHNLSDTSMGRLYALDFIDPLNGAMINNNRIFRTWDGGLTWSQPYVRDLQGGYYIDIVFVNNLIGFIVGGEGPTASSGFIIRTSDGGENWARVGTEIYPRLSALSFINERQGWICGDGGTLLSTLDSGKTWIHGDILVSPNPTFTSIQFVDNNFGWVGSRDDWLGFYRTEDGGTTWIQQSYETLLGRGVQSFFFIDSMIGSLSTFPGAGFEIGNTVDGGKSWNFDESLGVLRIYSIILSSVNNGWAVGHNGAILNYSVE
ncbi:hypothetical protein HQ531_02420 [bacterium]|nr:hypothetical protein [bacterium]